MGNDSEHNNGNVTAKVGFRNPPVHTRFKKGNKANPRGANAHSPLKSVRKLTLETFKQCIELGLTANIDELKKVVSDPNSTAVQVGISTALIKAIQRGDWSTFESISARILGKIPDKIEMTSNNTTALSVIDNKKLKMAIEKLESDV